MNEASSPDLIDSVVADWQRARPETSVDAIQIVGRIIWLGRRYEEAVTRMLSETGLAYSDFDVIATLRRAGSPYELTPTELSRRVLLTSGGLTACLRRLETAGLISRRGVPEDRRRLLAQLTAKGFDLIESFIDPRFEAADEALALLNSGQKETLETLLRRLVSQASAGH